jgi:hypothetical protein
MSHLRHDVGLADARAAVHDERVARGRPIDVRLHARRRRVRASRRRFRRAISGAPLFPERLYFHRALLRLSISGARCAQRADLRLHGEVARDRAADVRGALRRREGLPRGAARQRKVTYVC